MSQSLLLLPQRAEKGHRADLVSTRPPSACFFSEHIKPGQIAPALHCEYEDLSDLPAPSTGKPKGGKKVDKLETRVQQLEGLLRQVVGSAVVDAVGAGGTWNAQAGPSSEWF